MPSKSRLFSQLIAGSGQIKADRLSDDISTIEQVASTEDLTAVGNTVGDQRVINNNLYIWNGTGWYRIALINANPTWDSGGQPAVSYALDADSPQDPTIITLAASDPDGITINYSYVTGGSMDSMATISQDSSIFTITPKTVAEVGEGVELTGSITFRASDGVNILPQVSSFTLNFISIITNSKYTSLLATATGTSDNNNITDASSNSHTITVNGDAHAGTFSPYRSGGYSLEFNGSNSRIGIQSSNVQIGTSAFTIEFWAYSNDFAPITSSKYSNSNTNGYFLISATSSDGFRCRTRSTDGTQKYVNSGSGTYNLNEWNHCIFQRDAAGNLTSYLNGTKYTGENDGSTNLSATELGLGVFNYTGFESWFDGYIRDFKLTIGTSALRTDSNITVPIEPLTSDSNTTAFLGHLPYLVDGSSSSNTVVFSNASTKPFSPYDYLEYSATDYGGSVHFDGSGDKLAVGGSASDFNFGTNSFTIEGWVYSQVAAVGSLFNTHRVGIGSGYYLSWIADNTITWGNYVDGTGNVSTGAGAFTQNTWNHISVNRDASSSNSLKIYVNGVLKYTGTSATNYNTFDYGPYIGGYDSGGTQYDFTGHLSDIVVVNGSVLRTGGTSVGDVAFTPPTTPIATPSNTKLHIKGTDASIIDKSQGTNLLIDGTTITGVSTGSKYSKAIKNTAASSAIKVCTPSEFNMRTNDDFTIEFWFKVDPTSSYSATNYPKYILQIQYGGIVFGIWANPSTTKIEGNGAKTDGSGYITWSSSSFTSYTQNQWHHYALSFDKANTTAKWFLDGTLYHTDTSYDDPSTSVTNSTGTYMVSLFGEAGTVNSNTTFIGSIEDFRFSQFTRYTANFTPPTASLEG